MSIISSVWPEARPVPYTNVLCGWCGIRTADVMIDGIAVCDECREEQ